MTKVVFERGIFEANRRLGKVVIFKVPGRVQPFFWHLISVNGKIISNAETFKSKAGAMRNLKNTQRLFEMLSI